VCTKRLIDSKIEESTHHYSASTLFDPVLSGSVTIQYESSQRLIDEICDIVHRDSKKKLNSNNGNKKNTSLTSTTISSTSPSNDNRIIQRNDAKKIVQELCHRTHSTVQEVAQVQARHNNINQKSPRTIKKGDRIELEGHAPVYTLVYHRHKQWKKPYCIKINTTHYDKLYSMFVQTHQMGTSSTGSGTDNKLQFRNPVTGQCTMTTHMFHYLLMIILIRYSSLSGGQLLLDLRGGGMQGAVHDTVFDTLSQTLFPMDYMVECFGSPLNAYLSTGYYSAFVSDLDWHFGARGNFFHDVIVENNCCCEANPPFAPGIMSAMADQIHVNLQLANDQERILTFVVIVPHGGGGATPTKSDDPQQQQTPPPPPTSVVHRAAAKRYGNVSLQRMIQSEYCTYHCILPAKEHGYVEGAQHLRPTRYKESVYDTSIVVLQSTLAQTQRTLDPVLFESTIRHAFQSRHRDEVERRGQK
jgi:phosphorylated CTD-interacting factor 1